MAITGERDFGTTTAGSRRYTRVMAAASEKAAGSATGLSVYSQASVTSERRPGLAPRSCGRGRRGPRGSMHASIHRTGEEPCRTTALGRALSPLWCRAMSERPGPQPDRDPGSLVLLVLEQAGGSPLVLAFTSEERLRAALPNPLSYRPASLGRLAVGWPDKRAAVGHRRRPSRRADPGRRGSPHPARPPLTPKRLWVARSACGAPLFWPTGLPSAARHRAVARRAGAVVPPRRTIASCEVLAKF
jgi:hypothetical protein